MTEGASYNRFNLRNSWPVWFLLGVFVVLLIFMRSCSRSSQQPLSPSESEELALAPSAPLEAESPPGPQEELDVSEAPIPSVSIEQEDSEDLSVSLPSPEALAGSKKPFTIQVFSFQDKAKAQKALETIRQAGFPAYIVSRTLKEKGVWYRVCVGEFDTKEEADQMLAPLRKDFKDSFVIAR